MGAFSSPPKMSINPLHLCRGLFFVSCYNNPQLSENLVMFDCGLKGSYFYIQGES